MYLYRLKRIGISVVLGCLLMGCSDTKETGAENGLAERIETEAEHTEAAGTETNKAEAETEGKRETAESMEEDENTGKILADEESRLLQLLEEKSGQKMEMYLYTDMNHDGEKEMLGAFSDDTNYHIWYINGEGSVCEKAEMIGRGFEVCVLSELDLGTETHVAVNAYNTMGTDKQFSILALHGDVPEALVSNQNGNVRQNEAGDILLSVEDYDGMFDGESWSLHTFKESYLYYEDGTYKEYGAVVLDDEDFMKYDNAAEVLADIQEQNGSDKIVFSYFLRENEILHIQCELEETGLTRYFYYTMNIDGNRLWGDEDNYHDGNMQTSFSELEITYPEVEH